ncbi:type II secretion system major pseudopilin GspG [Desertibaculum subflavum]|uniref:type II secretion system major pseudopilin GspG n=1 Tax=Desertibaculum subflavum TaxID=2268458 RepID=UPI0034D293E9
MRSPYKSAMRSPPRRRGTEGFTLLELLVVLAILALLGGIVGVQVIGYLGTAKTETAKLQMQEIATALDLFRLDAGRYPTQSEGLKALIERPAAATRWNGPYLRSGSVPNDPWSRPYQYRIPGSAGREFELASFGADGQPGGTGEAADVALK